MSLVIRQSGNTPAFTGIFSKILDKGMSNFHDSKPMQKAIDWATKETINSKGEKTLNFRKIEKWNPIVFGPYIAMFYILNAFRSKEIPAKRKKFYAINITPLTALGLAAGQILNKAIDPLLKTADEILITHPDKKMLRDGLHAGVPLLTFALTLRYLAPVVSTPISQGINKFLVKHNFIKDTESTKKETNFPANQNLRGNSLN